MVGVRHSRRDMHEAWAEAERLNQEMDERRAAAAAAAPVTVTTSHRPSHGLVFICKHKISRDAFQAVCFAGFLHLRMMILPAVAGAGGWLFVEVARGFCVVHLSPPLPSINLGGEIK
ncbi:hypothetical protein ACLB2K_006367 [Fragaria x ananassa]